MSKHFIKSIHLDFLFLRHFQAMHLFGNFSTDIRFDKSVIDSLTKEKVRIWTELAEELKAAGIMCGQTS